MHLFSRDDVPSVDRVLTPCTIHNSHESLRLEQHAKDVLVNVGMESDSLEVIPPQMQLPLTVDRIQRDFHCRKEETKVQSETGIRYALAERQHLCVFCPHN